MIHEDGSDNAGTELAAALAQSAVLATLAPSGLHSAPHVEALGQSHGPATHGVYRVTAAAGERGAPPAWSAILKILSPDAVPATGRDDPTSYLYWQRELLAIHHMPSFDGGAAICHYGRHHDRQ